MTLHRSISQIAIILALLFHNFSQENSGIASIVQGERQFHCPSISTSCSLFSLSLSGSLTWTGRTDSTSYDTRISSAAASEGCGYFTGGYPSPWQLPRVWNQPPVGSGQVQSECIHPVGRAKVTVKGRSVKKSCPSVPPTPTTPPKMQCSASSWLYNTV